MTPQRGGLLVLLACLLGVVAWLAWPQAAAPADGSVTVRYADVDGELAAVQEQVRADGTVEDAVRIFEEVATLPAATQLRVGSCDGSAYEPGARRVDVCVEDVVELRGLAEGARDEDAAATERGVLAATVLHELGHALLDQLDVPFTGQEEDVADQFAAYALTTTGSVDALLSASFGYQLYQDAFEQVADDEHGSDGQRAANLLCWVHGSDPDEHADLVDGEPLGEDRAVYCPEEWDDLERGWSDLLADAGATAG